MSIVNVLWAFMFFVSFLAFDFSTGTNQYWVSVQNESLLDVRSNSISKLSYSAKSEWPVVVSIGHFPAFYVVLVPL